MNGRTDCGKDNVEMRWRTGSMIRQYLYIGMMIQAFSSAFCTLIPRFNLCAGQQVLVGFLIGLVWLFDKKGRGT